MSEPLPAHLEQLGRQLVAAARELQHVEARRRRWRGRSLIALPTVAGGAVVAVLLGSATATTTPTYALKPQADGTYRLTINDVATAVPEVNAAFARLGINAVAIPVVPTCPAPDAGVPLMAPAHASGTSRSVTIDDANIPAGSIAFVAAEQTPSGVRFSMGTTAGVLPACINSDQFAPVMHRVTSTGD